VLNVLNTYTYIHTHSITQFQILLHATKLKLSMRHDDEYDYEFVPWYDCLIALLANSCCNRYRICENV